MGGQPEPQQGQPRMQREGDDRCKGSMPEHPRIARHEPGCERARQRPDMRRPSTSCMSYRPGARPARNRHARKLPCAYVARLDER